MTDLYLKKFPVLNDGFICLIDVMGKDDDIVEAARKSYGKSFEVCPDCDGTTENGRIDLEQHGWADCDNKIHDKNRKDRRNNIRFMMSHGHTSPFEMVEVKFLVRVPMDCWRQWIRHRTANVNEYSTRYSEAIDSQQTTHPEEWRLQATDNKQGSSGFLTDWPEGWSIKNNDDGDPDVNYEGTCDLRFNGQGFTLTECTSGPPNMTPGEHLQIQEQQLQSHARSVYERRLALGVAKEQARKDLPLSTYTEAYWKCDLHNIFNFLRLRMDSHAQYEIRMYANAMAEIVKQLFPVAWEAFEDYVLYAKKFSRMEMECIRGIVNNHQSTYKGTKQDINVWPKPVSMTDREWKEFKAKLSLPS